MLVTQVKLTAWLLGYVQHVVRLTNRARGTHERTGGGGGGGVRKKKKHHDTGQVTRLE
jgi:hypothetical protein